MKNFLIFNRTYNERKLQIEIECPTEPAQGIKNFVLL